MGAITNDAVHEPEHLLRHIRETLYEQIVCRSPKGVSQRALESSTDAAACDVSGAPSPEQIFDEPTSAEVPKALADLPERDLEVLVRFYVMRQTADRICLDLHLTPTQLRLARSRAKKKFASLRKNRRVKK